ncbi:hypothetical protein ACOAOT_14925 [Lacrimispora sp. AGF001]|uniref:hypothetical protein n=1 Tax=Lacrimispora sp. AGF001 TaxID=3401631 RepID=UPI003B43D1F4
MNYAWEAALAADRAGIKREDVRYVPVSNGSPYTEVTLETINSKCLEEKRVEINPLYRFSREFSEMFDINLAGFETARNIFFDAAMQYLVQLDLRQGLSKQEYALRFLLRDLLEGVCGSQAARVAEQFEKEKLRQLLRLILKLYQCGSSIYLFREVMRYMYPDSMVYANNEAARQVLVYVGLKETEAERERLEFLQDMFLPINYQVFLFWEHHFGIIDVEETMEFDQVVLF